MRRLTGGIAHHRYNCQGADRNQAVGNQIKHYCRDTGRTCCDNAHQDETGLRHRGIREHPLDITLGECNQRPNQHAEDRDSPQDDFPVPLNSGKCHVKQTHHGAESSNLDRGAHESGNWGRCTLIHIRCPLVKWNGAHFKEQSNQQHGHADHDQKRFARGRCQ